MPCIGADTAVSSIYSRFIILLLGPGYHGWYSGLHYGTDVQVFLVSFLK
jgi:hypothetical protein